ncbi:MAG: hypothetical protein JNL75_10670 [Chitinophagales bacterium]|nr:hypothetical protein [Chitinophagales bacterium]
MNIKRLNNSVEMLKEYLGDSLVACDIWMTNTGQSIAGYNTQPKATALFEQVTSFLKKALMGAGFPPLEKYYMLDCEGDSMILVLQFEKYQWGMLVAKSKIQLGLLLNVIIPNVSEEFLEAIKS